MWSVSCSLPLLRSDFPGAQFKLGHCFLIQLHGESCATNNDVLIVPCDCVCVLGGRDGKRAQREKAILTIVMILLNLSKVQYYCLHAYWLCAV